MAVRASERRVQGVAPRLAIVAVTWLAAATLFASVGGVSGEGQCVFTQNCHDGATDSSCHAVPATFKPSPMNFSGQACPQYAANSCCNHFQNQYLSFNFMLIDSMFGYKSLGGCPACANNIKRLWCEYTCSPNQVGLRNMTDPEAPTKTPTVLWAAINTDRDTACDVFASCQDTLHCRQVQSLKSCNSFLDFQGQTEAIGHGDYLEFVYTDKDGVVDTSELHGLTELDHGRMGQLPLPPLQFNSSLKFDPYDCSNFTLPGSAPDSCACSACANSCKHESQGADVAEIIRDAEIKPLNGAQWGLIGVAYAGIFVVSVAILMYRSFMGH